MSNQQNSVLPSPTPHQLETADRTVGIVNLISGKTGKGEDFYAYVSILPSRYEDFTLISRAGEQMDIKEFGEVLLKGFGKKPPPEIRRQMEERYGVDHSFLTNLQKELHEMG